MALSFMGALAAGYAVTVLKLSKKRHALDQVEHDAPVRMKSECGMYRARFLGAQGKNLLFSSPILRDAYVPLRVGLSLTIEIPRPKGVIIFRTQVIHRDPVTHTFVVARPSDPMVLDRREEPRSERFAGTQVSLNEEWGELMDLSVNGARFQTFFPFSAGDVIKVHIPLFHACVLGWVLDASPIDIGARTGTMIRVRFVDPLPPIPIDVVLSNFN
ncbi:MAG: flagellar brake domain-containing protein [Armatimonadetes bacterium]|nr:flagellar brake domain-containing protein [Armatimonadota bacterium]